MKNYAFHIEFETAELQVRDARKEYKYQALITTISSNFQLFKISNIKRLTKDGTITISGVYHITSYPLSGNKASKWMDPLTHSTNTVLQIIGDGIENYLNNDHTKN